HVDSAIARAPLRPRRLAPGATRAIRPRPLRPSRRPRPAIPLRRRTRRREKPFVTPYVTNPSGIYQRECHVIRDKLGRPFLEENVTYCVTNQVRLPPRKCHVLRDTFSKARFGSVT